MFRLDHRFAAVGFGGGQTPVAVGILRKLLKAMPHQHRVALCNHGIARGIPHHARAKAWVAESFQERLCFHAVVGLLVEAKAAFQAINDCCAK